MTTKPRQPRPITLGLAIDRLLAIRAAGEVAATKAAAKARARYVARWDATMATVPEHLMPAVRSAIAASAGSIEEQAEAASRMDQDAVEPDDSDGDEPPLTGSADATVSAEIASALASPVAGHVLADAEPAVVTLPGTVEEAAAALGLRGTAPYVPGPVARAAARGTR